MKNELFLPFKLRATPIVNFKENRFFSHFDVLQYFGKNLTNFKFFFDVCHCTDNTFFQVSSTEKVGITTTIEDLVLALSQSAQQFFFYSQKSLFLVSYTRCALEYINLHQSLKKILCNLTSTLNSRISSLIIYAYNCYMYNISYQYY